MADFDKELGLLSFDIGKRFGEPQLIGGMTGLDKTKGFVKVRLEGIDSLYQQLESLVREVAARDTLERIVRRAARPIYDGYREAAEWHEATGNLAASTKIRVKSYDRATVAIVGPEQTGRSASTSEKPSGNHAWLTEWGTRPRRPGTQGRRTYINVHTAINGHMARHSAVADVDFKRMSGGYYFLMGSLRERTRQAKRGSGYSHDFMPDDGRGMHPMTLHPGETYGAMPALHLMQKTIDRYSSATLRALEDGLVNAIDRAMQKASA